MFPTPSLAHLTRSDYKQVYEPAEDTFLLLDALEQDVELLTSSSSAASPSLPRLVVEIGSGSGCVSAFIAKIIGPRRAAYICTDINPLAAECTKRTAKANECTLEPVVTSTLAALLPRLQSQHTPAAAGLVDVLLFNPPYVPTTPEEEALAQEQAAIAGSWAGGWTGTALLDGLIDDVCGRGRGGVESLLSVGGRFYCIAIKQNDPDKLVEKLQARGLEAAIVLSRRAGREHLFVIRATRTS